MKILMFGDVVGRAGREAIKKILPTLKEKFDPDIICANGENLAHGLGVTSKTAYALLKIGVDVITSGNHIFARKEGTALLNKKDLPLLRPANYPPKAPGKGDLILEVRTKKILVVNLIGRVFFQENFDCPFRVLEQILEKKKTKKLMLFLSMLIPKQQAKLKLWVTILMGKFLPVSEPTLM